MMTAMDGFCALASRSRSSPDPSGSIRSHKTRSGSLFWIAARASASVAAISTAHPSSSKTMVRKSRMEVSSSTMRRFTTPRLYGALHAAAGRLLRRSLRPRATARLRSGGGFRAKMLARFPSQGTEVEEFRGEVGTVWPLDARILHLKLLKVFDIVKRLEDWAREVFGEVHFSFDAVFESQPDRVVTDIIGLDDWDVVLSPFFEVFAVDGYHSGSIYLGCFLRCSNVQLSSNSARCSSNQLRTSANLLFGKLPMIVPSAM